MPDNQSKLPPIQNQEHYTYQVKLLIDMYNAGLLPEVQQLTVEPRYGYVATILYHNGTSRVVYGHDTGFNAGSSEKLAKDKGYAKFVLREMGVACARGEAFLLPWWADALQRSSRQGTNSQIISTDQADAYIQSEIGYPVFIKPADGSQGRGVQKVHTASELAEVLQYYNDERVKVALIEEVIDLPDYRLLIVDGELVNAYERKPFAVQGDGVQTIGMLIRQAADRYQTEGRDIHVEYNMPRITQYLGRDGLTLDTIPAAGKTVRLLDISNLSAGGLPVDVTTALHPRWVELARTIAKGFNLRICGVDLACSDITSAEAKYAVIEVNATPGAKQFMASGVAGREKLEQLFLQLFRTAE